jgi:hypothetical protein
MKRLITLLLSFSAFNSIGQTPHTIVLRPGPSGAVNTSIWKEMPFGGNSTDQNIIANAWTAGGGDVTLRTLFRFSMPTLPANATFTGATLYLYGNPMSNHPQLHSNYPGSPFNDSTNEGWLMRITSAWNPTTVGWSNQPTTSSSNVVSLQASTTQTQNYVLNVSQLVKDMLDTPSSSFGFMLRLQNENKYRALVFASSYNTDSTIRPSLVINYTTPNTAVGSVANNEGGAYVFPNPASDELYIRFKNAVSGRVEVSIADVTGRTVLQHTGDTKDIKLEVGQIPRGVYFLRIRQAGKAEVTYPFSLRD